MGLIKGIGSLWRKTSYQVPVETIMTEDIQTKRNKSPRTVNFAFDYPHDAVDQIAPVNLREAIDDIDEDCIAISERTTENARALSDLVNTLLNMQDEEGALCELG
jgi:hypothetical protein